MLQMNLHRLLCTSRVDRGVSLIFDFVLLVSN